MNIILQPLPSEASIQGAMPSDLVITAKLSCGLSVQDIKGRFSKPKSLPPGCLPFSTINLLSNVFLVVEPSKILFFI